MLKCLVQNLTHSKYPGDLTVFVDFNTTVAVFKA